MNEKILAYIETLQDRIALLRMPPSGVESTEDVRVALETAADSLEEVVRELTDLLEIRETGAEKERSQGAAAE